MDQAIARTNAVIDALDEQIIHARHIACSHRARKETDRFRVREVRVCRDPDARAH
jgi:hypothetical protein